MVPSCIEWPSYFGHEARPILQLKFKDSHVARSSSPVMRLALVGSVRFIIPLFLFRNDRRGFFTIDDPLLFFGNRSSFALLLILILLF